MTESSSSGSSRMERIRPEKTPRQRVQKLWRNVRWAESFPDESVSMENVDITPNFALRKIALLFETKRYDECATLIRRMNQVTLGNILAEVPLEVLHDSMPFSLPMLEALYVKLYDTSFENFPKEQLCVDQLLKRMVACFAKMNQPENKLDKNCNSYYPSCRNILRVALSVDPQIKQQLKQKKKAIDKCLKHLGQHGLVNCSSGHLMNLHDALKLEFEKVSMQYKSAIQKLDEFSSANKLQNNAAHETSKAPFEVSHQRLMQQTRCDIQDRIIQNKTVFNIAEPAITNQYLKKLIYILERRIEFDKLALFHENELRKICNGLSEEAYMSVTLKHFAQGYGVVMKLLREISDEEDLFSDEEEILSTDDELLSPLSNVEKIKTVSGHINGFLPYKNGNSLRTELISAPFPVRLEIHNGYKNGFKNNLISHSMNGSTISILNGNAENHAVTMATLEQEVDRLKIELEQSKQSIKKLQDREKEINDRLLSKQNGHFLDSNSNISVDHSRKFEWVERYGNLFSDSRTQALALLDRLDTLGDLNMLKEKLLFSVIVLSFRAVQQEVHELHGKLRHLLQMPVPDVKLSQLDSESQRLEQQICRYLCTTSHKHDITSTTKEVFGQICATLYDYPCLKECQGLEEYVRTCVRVAWGLSVQHPPFLLSYDSRTFQENIHTRTESSDKHSNEIKGFVWPSLTDGYGGPCVHKAIVIT